MAKYIVALALLGCAVAEPPVGYSYSAPSSIHSIGGLSSGGHYTQVPVGHQESEGYHIDPHLLHKIKGIILRDEIQNQAYSGASSGHHHISSHYGVPAPVYGVPQDRIVGIELDHIQQGIQVAQYHQAEAGYASGYAGGYSSGGYSSGGYSSGGYSSGHGHGPSISFTSGPSESYHTIGVPSGSYGVPIHH